MSLAFKPVIASRGNAQKGWSIFVNWSPYAKAIIAFCIGTPKLIAASIIIGPCVIGDNSVIGAGCVISKDIPKNSYCVMGTQDQLVTKKLRVTEPKRSC